MRTPLSVLRAPRLAAQASHEVRGPLTVALLALEGMVARDEVDRDGALALEHQLARARLALEDLTAASTGGRAPDRLEPADLRVLLARIALAWRPVAEAGGIELRVRAGAFGGLVLADPTRVAQAVGNLLHNAFEHGTGPVELRGRVVGDRARFEVHDAGPGLRAPIGVLARRPRGGRGHGLSIAADIARRHRGRLLAAPTARGAALVFELPLRERAPERSDGAARGCHGGAAAAPEGRS